MASKAVNALRAECDVLEAQIKEINEEHKDERLPDDVAERWNRLNQTRDDYEKRIELLQRQERVEELSHRAEHVEQVGLDGKEIQYIKGQSYKHDPFDLSKVDRSQGPEREGQQFRDRAKYVIEELAEFPHEGAEKDDVKNGLTRMVEADHDFGPLARHMLATGSPQYKRAWAKYVAGSFLSSEETRTLESTRALSLTGSAGGFAVPFVLDPTIIPTSNLAVNPFRAISRVEQITVDEWRGISSGGITAAYAAEATATSDNAPTLAQPTISTEKAQAFIPFSIEVGMDWNGLQTQMATLLQDAKDELEATKFAVGSGTNEPQGVITGATTVFTASGTASFAYADLDGLEAALPPRFRPRASMVLNRAIAQRIRHFDTATGAAWSQGVQLVTGLPNAVPVAGSYQTQVLGYPAYESSAMASALTTGSLIAILGDFRYYVIVDRIGLSIETIPHLFDVTNNRPTGQRGLYAYWRNGAGVVSASAFRVLKTA